MESTVNTPHIVSRMCLFRLNTLHQIIATLPDHAANALVVSGHVMPCSSAPIDASRSETAYAGNEFSVQTQPLSYQSAQACYAESGNFAQQQITAFTSGYNYQQQFTQLMPPQKQSSTFERHDSFLNQDEDTCEFNPELNN